MWWRIKLLVTGKVEYEDIETGEVVDREKLSRTARWVIAKPLLFDSSRWKWVQKFGAMDCGCVRNPITRRIVLYRWQCPGGHCSM